MSTVEIAIAGGCLVLLVLLGGMLTFRSRSPYATSLAVLLFVLAVVPYWVGVGLAGRFVPTALFALAACAFFLRARVVLASSMDRVLISLALLVLGLVVSGLVLPGHAIPVLSVWPLAYFLGHAIAREVSADVACRIFAWFGLILAAAAVAELVLNFHPFSGLTWPNSPSEIWRPIQVRAGRSRSELAMGHSIVLGSVLALSIPFIYSVAWPAALRWGSLLLVGAGIGATFSRAALLTAVAALVLSVLLDRQRGSSGHVRLGLLVAGTLLALVVVPTYLAAISSGSELDRSTAYRAGYIEVVGDLHLLGLAKEIYVEDAGGRFGWLASSYPGGVIVTLDNAFLLTALQFGIVVAALLVALMVCAAMTSLSPRSSPASIALLAQGPALATAAMNTQYPYYLWLVAGLAAGWSLQRSRHAVRAQPTRQSGGARRPLVRVSELRDPA